MKGIIALILVISAGIVNLYGYYASKAPSVKIQRLEGVKLNYWSNLKLPPANFTLAETYTFEGTLSVNNPVHIRAVMLSSNLPFDTAVQDYPYLAFTESINANAPNDKSDIPSFSKLVWLINGTASYVAEGDIVWTREGPTWSFFVPHGKVAVNLPDVEGGMPSLVISGLSDTLNVKNNEITQRLTWIAAGFSILLLQPIFEAIFLKDPPPCIVPAKPQGIRSQDRRGPKLTKNANNPNKQDSHDKIDAVNNHQG